MKTTIQVQAAAWHLLPPTRDEAIRVIEQGGPCPAEQEFFESYDEFIEMDEPRTARRSDMPSLSKSALVEHILAGRVQPAPAT
jgi:hypothetical protein